MINKNVFLILITIFTFFSFNHAFAENIEDANYTNPYTNYKVLIDDKIGYFDENQKENLLEYMIPITDYGNVMLKITNGITLDDIETISYFTYYEVFENSSGVLLLFNSQGQDFYIYSTGNVKNKGITTTKSTIIIDNIRRLVKSGEYYDFAKEAFIEINDVLTGKGIAEPMRYITSILLALSLGFITTFVFVFKYSNVETASREDILKNARIKFNIENVKVSEIGKHSVYVPESQIYIDGSPRGRGRRR